jgi:hypothetical protein
MAAYSRALRSRGRVLAEPEEERLRHLVTAQPDRTLAELRGTPFRQWQTHTGISGVRLDGLTAPAVCDRPIDTPSVRADVEHV